MEVHLVRQIDADVEYEVFDYSEWRRRMADCPINVKDAILVVFADSTDAHIDETFNYTVGLRTVVESENAWGVLLRSLGMEPRLMALGLLILWVPLLVRRRNSLRWLGWDQVQ